MLLVGVFMTMCYRGFPYRYRFIGRDRIDGERKVYEIIRLADSISDRIKSSLNVAQAK